MTGRPIPIMNRVGATTIPSEHHGKTPDELFLAGFDTFDIAAHFSIYEAVAARLISQQREARIAKRMAA